LEDEEGGRWREAAEGEEMQPIEEMLPISIDAAMDNLIEAGASAAHEVGSKLDPAYLPSPCDSFQFFFSFPVPDLVFSYFLFSLSFADLDEFFFFQNVCLFLSVFARTPSSCSP
jgi:hypothetical protein